jgi:hypothetical protein
VVTGEPRVEIFTDAGGSRIGVRTPAPEADIPPSPLVEIDVRRRQLGGSDVVEISTNNGTLIRDFYAFACSVADRLQVDGMPVVTAVEAALGAWAALLQRLALLDDQRQAGLMGELWLLRLLAESDGWPAAISAWKGTDAEEHDFSLPHADVEVKTTLSEKRLHIVGSLTQLVPTGSRPLYVLSVQLTGAGAGGGDSLTDAVRKSLRDVAADPESLRRLRTRLEHAGWVDDHAAHYRRPFTLRTPPQLVPVDDDCPAITPDALAGLGDDRLARIGQVAYRIDVTGLGHEFGSDAFHEVLPRRGDP